MYETKGRIESIIKESGENKPAAKLKMNNMTISIWDTKVADQAEELSKQNKPVKVSYTTKKVPGYETAFKNGQTIEEIQESETPAQFQQAFKPQIQIFRTPEEMNAEVALAQANELYNKILTEGEQDASKTVLEVAEEFYNWIQSKKKSE